MSTIYKTLELPVNEYGKYLLTKEALKVIKSARTFVARYDTRSPHECFFRAIVEERLKSGDKVEIFYDMPINVKGKPYKRHFTFSGHASTYGDLHPMQLIAKEGMEISFEPYKDAGTNDFMKARNLACDKVYVIMHINKDKICRIEFDEGMREVDSQYRIVRIEEFNADFVEGK